MDAEDQRVQNTANDACACKYGASLKGYFADPYLSSFVRAPVIKPPIINRGYYARITAVNMAVAEFMQQTASAECRQIVNLGPGFDTLFFNLLQQGQQNVTCYDVDFPDVVRQKSTVIRNNAT